MVEPESALEHDFSLFEGDPLNRFFARLGIGSTRVLDLFLRFLLLLLVTAVPTALLALWQGYGPNQPLRSLNFFADFSAFGQALLGYPLFILAEYKIEKTTRSAGRHMLSSGVVPQEYLPELHRLHDRVGALRRKAWIEIACLVLGLIFGLLWLYEETHNLHDTWHAVGAPAAQSPTHAGWWVALVGIPIFNFWWIRWMWKISLWCWYLNRVSRFPLRLIASHPDLTGGLGFVSDAQKSFAIVIFAFGIGIIAPVVAYKLDVEGASLFSYATGGPLLGFVIGAPIFFTLPLLMFTKQLARTKKRAMDAYQSRATEAALSFEQGWLHARPGVDSEVLFGKYLQGMKNLNLAFEHMKKMRVVPFDVRSFGQLAGSTVGSLLPLLPKLTTLPEPALHVIEILKPLLPR